MYLHIYISRLETTLRAVCYEKTSCLPTSENNCDIFQNKTNEPKK